MELKELTLITNDIDVEENKADIEMLMNENGFRFSKVAENRPYTMLFWNEDENVICEVNSINFAFKLLYANPLMTGFLDTGWHDDIRISGFLKQVMIEFKEPVSLLRKYYEK